MTRETSPDVKKVHVHSFENRDRDVQLENGPFRGSVFFSRCVKKDVNLINPEENHGQLLSLDVCGSVDLPADCPAPPRLDASLPSPSRPSLVARLRVTNKHLSRIRS